MKIENSFSVPLQPADAWTMLLDIPTIVPCMPGAELIAIEEERSYRGQVKVKLGPVAVVFQGRARLTRVEEATHTVEVAASGNEAKGRGSAQATVLFRLHPDAAGSRVDITTDLALAGAVAQYGRAQGVIASVSQVLVDTFADNLKARVAAAGSAHATSDRRQAAATSAARAPVRSAPSLSLFSLIIAALRRWFSRKRTFAL